MLFEKKYERAMNLLKEKNNHEESSEDGIEKRIQENESNHDKKEDMSLEKNDWLAMMISAFIVFIPVAIFVLGIFVGIAWLLGLW